MAKVLQKIGTVTIIAALMLHLSSVLTEASINLQASASQSGFQITYQLPFMNFGNIDLARINDQSEIDLHFLFIKLISIKLKLAAINTENVPQSLTLQYEIASRFLSDTLPSGSIEIPFFDGGLRADLFGKKYQPIGTCDAEVSLLLTRKKTRYSINLNLPMLQDSWEGEATADHNTINEKVTMNGQDMADIQCTLEYTSRLFTSAAYSIEISPLLSLYKEQGDKATVQPIIGGPIPLPNGSYHAWVNMSK
jgi:hypothetical protein